MNEFNPDWRSAPGDTIKDILEENSVSVGIFAECMNLTFDEAQQLLNGQMRIDEDLAIQLWQNIGASPDFWLKREANYRMPIQFWEILHKFPWPIVQNAILTEYPDQAKNINGYYAAFRELQNTEIVESEYTIWIRTVEARDDVEAYEDVYLMHPDYEHSWGMDFINWSEVLGMTVAPEMLAKYTREQIVAHVMYELTFYGFTNQEVQAEGEHILDIKNDALEKFSSDQV